MTNYVATCNLRINIYANISFQFISVSSAHFLLDEKSEFLHDIFAE